MPLPNIFTPEVTNNLLQRIETLTPSSQANWGKMNVSQMLAHCNVTYEMMFENIHPKPNAILKFILKLLVKKKVVDETTYPKESRTAPAFLITTEKDFQKEKERLIQYMKKTQELGEIYFDGRESHSFGILTKVEWNNMLYKHLDHHLRQFGA
ncbi:MAG: DinB family protein [Candidatus Kapabacteria bacterium]|nr:DinB family protein [Candidatus Kapabacteria bacterium]